MSTGDVLHTGASAPVDSRVGLTLPEAYRPQYRATLRVILGPQDDAFTPQGIETLFSSVYTVTNETDRMGCRLDGPTIAHRGEADIISDGLTPGAIQIPAHGAPIIMLADCQTTGGYAKIAAVISVDIPSVAQMKPGDTLSFERISIEAAQRLYREREARMDTLRAWVAFEKSRSIPPITTYLVTINGQSYRVRIQAR
jgi:biotin-dependent carboxylase-like uncharacterized protein